MWKTKYGKGIVLTLAACLFGACLLGCNEQPDTKPSSTPTQKVQETVTATPTAEPTGEPSATPTELPYIDRMYAPEDGFRYSLGFEHLPTYYTTYMESRGNAGEKPERITTDASLEERLYAGEVVKVDTSFAVDFNYDGIREEVWYYYDEQQEPRREEHVTGDYTYGCVNIGSYAYRLQLAEELTEKTPECYLACLGGTNSKQVYLILKLPENRQTVSLIVLTYATRNGQEYLLRNTLFPYEMNVPEQELSGLITVGESASKLTFSMKDASKQELYVTCAPLYTEVGVLEDHVPNKPMEVAAAVLPRLVLVDEAFQGYFVREEPSWQPQELYAGEVKEGMIVSQTTEPGASQYRLRDERHFVKLGENADGTMVGIVGLEANWFGWIPKN